MWSFIELITKWPNHHSIWPKENVLFKSFCLSYSFTNDLKRLFFVWTIDFSIMHGMFIYPCLVSITDADVCKFMPQIVWTCLLAFKEWERSRDTFRIYVKNFRIFVGYNFVTEPHYIPEKFLRKNIRQIN